VCRLSNAAIFRQPSILRNLICPPMTGSSWYARRADESEDRLKTACRVVSAVALALFVTVAFAQPEPLRPLRLTPDQLTWTADPRGYEQALIVGDPTKPGIYVARLRFPSNLRIAPHFHPDDRIVTVLSGTVLFGYGERFDETTMQALSAGSVWTEPAKQPHFAWSRDGEVVLQVIGMGPSGTTPVP